MKCGSLEEDWNQWKDGRLTCNVALDHSHAVGGKGACLVWTDGCSIAHSLTRIQVTHQVVVMHHFLPWKREILQNVNHFIQKKQMKNTQ